MPAHFRDITMEQAKYMMGTRLPEHAEHAAGLAKGEEPSAEEAAALPETFEAKDKWPFCDYTIRDQGHCGSCWAFGTTEAFSDRLCIAAGKKMPLRAPQQLVSCDKGMCFGCGGGIPSLAWDYTYIAGLKSETCLPYASGDGHSPSCSKTKSQCHEKGYKSKFLSVKHYSSEASIMKALMTDGPLTAGFNVFEDFMTYKSGIYKHHSGIQLGGHAVKLVGWGVEDGTVSGRAARCDRGGEARSGLTQAGFRNTGSLPTVGTPAGARTGTSGSCGATTNAISSPPSSRARRSSPDSPPRDRREEERRREPAGKRETELRARFEPGGRQVEYPCGV